MNADNVDDGMDQDVDGSSDSSIDDFTESDDDKGGY